MVNVTKIALSQFYIFKIETIRDDYIQLCKPKNLYGYAIKSMDDYFPSKKFLFFFKRYILNGISLKNRHLLILNGHGSHVTLEVIE